jgi:hypothetical protein
MGIARAQIFSPGSSGNPSGLIKTAAYPGRFVNVADSVSRFQSTNSPLSVSSGTNALQVIPFIPRATLSIVAMYLTMASAIGVAETFFLGVYDSSATLIKATTFVIPNQGATTTYRSVISGGFAFTAGTKYLIAWGANNNSTIGTTGGTALSNGFHLALANMYAQLYGFNVMGSAANGIAGGVTMPNSLGVIGSATTSRDCPDVYLGEL